MAKNEEQSIEDRVARKNDGLQNTKDTLDSKKDTHEYQMMVQRQYQHMVHRMNTDLIAIQIRFNETSESYKNKHQVYMDEAERSR